MKNIRPFTRALILVTLITLDALMWSGTDSAQAATDTAAAATAALIVSETTATEAEWPEVIKATGSIFPWQEAAISPEISGHRLVSVLVDVGDTVREGQVLAKFNTEILKAEYAELEATWTAAEANRQRVLKLRKSGAMSAQAIDDFVSQADVARARLEVKALQLKYADIVAPDDGVISTRNAMLGAVVSPGDELFRLIRKNRLEWRGELTAEQAALATQGQTVTLTLPNGDAAQGSIRQVAPTFNPETRLINLFVDIEPGSKARVGMYAKGQITLGQQASLSVPVKSVVMRGGRHFVFGLHAQDSGTIVRQQEVAVGQTRDNVTQILSGITQDDRIVLKGAGFLNDGDSVRVVEEQGDKE